MTDTQTADLLTMLDVTTADGAIDVVRRLLDERPLIGVDHNGQLRAMAGVTIGQALQLLDAARAQLLNTRIA